MITSEGRELRRRIEGAYLEHVRGKTSATQYLGALGDLLDEEADRRAVREGDPDCRHLEHILSELRYEVAIHEMVEDFKRIQAEHRAEMASANSQLRRALEGNRLRERMNLSLIETHEARLRMLGERLGPVADVARQLEELADCAHDWEGVLVAAGDLRDMAGDLRKAGGGLREALGTADDG